MSYFKNIFSTYWSISIIFSTQNLRRVSNIRVCCLRVLIKQSILPAYVNSTAAILHCVSRNRTPDTCITIIRNNSHKLFSQFDVKMSTETFCIHLQQMFKMASLCTDTSPEMSSPFVSRQSPHRQHCLLTVTQFYQSSSVIYLKTEDSVDFVYQKLLILINICWSYLKIIITWVRFFEPQCIQADTAACYCLW